MLIQWIPSKVASFHPRAIKRQQVDAGFSVHHPCIIIVTGSPCHTVGEPLPQKSGLSSVSGMIHFSATSLFHDYSTQASMLSGQRSRGNEVRNSATHSWQTEQRATRAARTDPVHVIILRDGRPYQR